MRLREESAARSLIRRAFGLVSIPLDVASLFLFPVAATIALLVHGFQWSLLFALAAGGVVSLVAHLAPTVTNFRTKFHEIYRFRRA